jgi:uncharacterized membrane protein
MALLAAPVDWTSVIDPFLRWLHVLAGILWLGMTYFVHYVNLPMQDQLGMSGKRAVNPQLWARVFWLLRFAALFTLLFGILLFGWKYLHAGGEGMLFDEDLGRPTDRAMWIMWGMFLGIVMFAHDSFVVWPAHRGMLDALVKGDEIPARLVAKARKFSRVNTILSGPMLFAMILAAHYATMQWQVLVFSIVVGAAVPLLLIPVSRPLIQDSGSS